MEIKKFQNGQFGNLTTITNPKTGVTMFIAKEVADLWGHSNSRQAIKDAKLSDDEKKTITKSYYQNFFDQLRKQNLLANKTNQITLITESGLWKLALNSQKPEADSLKDWIARDVLPAIRKKGQYVIRENEFANISQHTSVIVQKQNSKDVNAINYRNGGVPKIIEHSTASCVLHTGKTPKQIKEAGLSVGLKKSECRSAKEVLRKVRPDIACGMSFTDNLVKQGHDLQTVAAISKKLAIPLFNELLTLGVRPIELSK